MEVEDIPINPPVTWFMPPSTGIPTDKRITILAGGRVYGYIALWNTCHTGHGNCVRAPRGSGSNYDYAHQGETLTAEGELIKTAVIAGGKGHAPIDMDSALVPEYYENMGTQLMRVRYGEDENGLWFAGALWPDVNDLQVAQIRATSISGDWRWHAVYRKSSSGYDFAGACFVNIPGFPMPTDGERFNDRAGQPYALAATAFMAPLAIGDEYVTLDKIQGDIDMKCDGNCSECTCGDSVTEVELTEEQVEELQAAGYQLHGKKLKKKPSTLKADAADEEVLPDPVAELTAVVSEMKESIDWLVSAKLISEITLEEA